MTVAIADLLPARLYFGHFRALMRSLLQSNRLVAVTQLPNEHSPPEPKAVVAIPADIRCAVVTGSLDVGGVEAVIGQLACELPLHGIDCTVVCRSGGRMANQIRG